MTPYQCSLLAWVGKKKIKKMARNGNWKLVGYLWLRLERGSIWMHKNLLRLSALCSFCVHFVFFKTCALFQTSMQWELTSFEQQVPCREPGQNTSVLTKKNYCGLGSSHTFPDFTACRASFSRRVFIFTSEYIQSCIVFECLCSC